MLLLKTKEAVELGSRVAALVEAGRLVDAYNMLIPATSHRIPFRMLDQIGEVIGLGALPPVNRFLYEISGTGTDGIWAMIGSALRQQTSRDLSGALARCRSHVCMADLWVATDILGERVPGHALVTQFDKTLEHLTPWREDQNRWVRRCVGVAVHYWAKQSQGSPDMKDQATIMLDFLSPMFEEWDLDAAKGVGWGFKTLGKYYPDLMADWLGQQVNRRHRTLVMKKALTYLSANQKARALGK